MSMNVDELRGRISTVNATVAKLNEQRSRNQGMRETLEKQKASAIATYAEKYGVDLTQVSIEEEFARVMQDKEREVGLLEKVITCINSGDYATANQLMGTEEGQAQPIQNASQSQAVAQPQPQVQATPQSQPTVAPPQFTAPAQPPVEPAMESITPPQAPKVEVPMSGVDTLTPPPMMGVGEIPTPVAPPAGITPPVSQPTGVPNVAPPPMFGESKPTVHAQSVGLDLSGLTAPIQPVNRATDFSSILNGQPFQP